MPIGPLHFKLAEPEDVVWFRTTLLGLKEQVRPAGTVSVRPTVPLKPLTAATAIVEFARRFVRTVELAGIVLIVKSTPATVSVVVEVRVPDVPVTVIIALPVCDPDVTVRVAFCFPPTARLTMLGVNLVTKPHAQPLAVAVRLTGPLKLPRLVIVIVELTDVPAGIVRVDGLAVILNP